MGTRITDLPVASTVNPADVVPVVQSGTTKQAASSLIKTTNASELTSGTVAVARLPLGTTSSAGVLQLGSTSGTACEGNDARLSNSRTPTGAAGGDLAGTYPNPTIAALSPSPAGSVGSSTVIPVVTVNAKGQVTSITGVAPQATVSSVNVSGGTTGLTFSGGPVTTSGTLTASGALGISNGGTGATSRQNAINALAGAVTSGRFLRGDGTNISLAQIQAADVPTLNQNTTGTASNVTGVVALINGGTGANTAAGARTNLGLAPSATIDTTNAENITSGILNSSRLPAFIGDVTTPQGSTTTTLSNTGVTAGVYGNAVAVPQITIDAKGRITSAVNIGISGSAGGTVTSVGVTSSTLSITNSPVTFTGDIGVNLPTSGVTAGTVGSSTQIPVITADAQGRITALTTAAISTLSPTGVTAGTYGAANSVAAFDVNSFGQLTGATSSLISISSAQITGLLATSQIPTISTSQISGLAASATTNTTNASNITSGTLQVGIFPASGVTPGTYGSSTQIPVLAVDSIGRITLASTATAAGTPTSVGYLRETITTSATAATGTINFDVLTQPTLHYTSNATGNFTLNIRGNISNTLDSLLTTAQSLTVTFLNTNGATPYGVSAVNVDGSPRTVKWLNGTGSVPTPNASAVDAWTLTIIKTAANTFTVLGSLSKFV
jgi:hypothetical protein